jgi:hypothetical protein
MQRLSKKAGLLAAALVMFFGGSARASTLDVKVPFPFVIQGRAFPAGEYRLERDAEDPFVFLIKGAKSHAEPMFFMTMPASDQDAVGEKAGVTFVRHESQYRLVEIWNAGSQPQGVMPTPAS